MAKKSSVETSAELAGHANAAVLNDLYNLRCILGDCVLAQDYVVDPVWTELIVPSKAGRELLARAADSVGDATEQELHLALLVRLYHHDLLIDPEQCKADLAIAQVESELLAGRLSLPFFFGRQLYDKFHDTAPPARTDNLEAEEATKLLEGTPIGIFQVNRLVSGPLGLLTSSTARMILPTRRLPLWHCSDTGCGALHFVDLLPPAARIVKIVQELWRTAFDTWGAASSYNSAFKFSHRGATWTDGRPYFDLIPLLAEAITESDRRTMLTALLTSQHATVLRASLQTKRGSKASSGPPPKVVAGLTDAETLQLLLVLEDAILVDALDHLIFDRAIPVAIHELRRPLLAHPKVNSNDRGSEISTLGVRAKHAQPAVHLFSAVWGAYEATGAMEELGWKIRARQGSPSRSAVADYLRRTPARQAIQDLVLSSMPIVRHVAALVGIEPQHDAEPSLLADRILWKLGFSPPRHDQTLSRLRARTNVFWETLLRVGQIKSEADREALRSAGVNLFVSLEEFIENLIAYNVWVLSADHFVDTDFEYRVGVALERVQKVLGASIEAGTQTLWWNSSGGNSLGVLLGYLSKASDWMAGLSSRDRAALVHSTEDLPHYSGDVEHPFPFVHRELWADLADGPLLEFVDGFGALTETLLKANVAEVRNGLDHQRSEESFPTQDAMLLCATRIRDAVEQADLKRYFPKLYWLDSKGSDRFGAVEYRLSDYDNRPLVVHGPSSVWGLPLLGFDRPILIPAGTMLDHVAATLRFTIAGEGEFADYWSNYPRRRFVPASARTPDLSSAGAGAAMAEVS